MTPTPAATPAGPTPLTQALRAQRSLFVRVGWFSFASGMMMLASPWFMFEVYGRVLNSRSHGTLAMLLLMVIGVYVVIELVDLVRGRLLAQAGRNVEEALRARLFDVVHEANLLRRPGGTPQVFTDLRTLRDFMASPCVVAVLDAPVASVMLLLLFLLNPWLGVMALVGAAIQGWVAWRTEKRTMPALMESSRASIDAQNYAHGALRNAQVIEAMGMLGAVRRPWTARQRRFLALQAEASDRAGTNATVAKLVQTMQGSLLLGAAALLVLEGTLWGGPGMMIVASILGGRVLAPLAQLVPQWRQVVEARAAYQRLESLLRLHAEPEPHMPLPPPQGVLTVEGVVVAAPGTQVPILRGVTFAARPGEVVGVIGPSAAGKTTLARVLLGIWPPTAGRVRLDGVDVYAWDKTELGPHVGYLPQGVELFDGTVAENVARFGELDRAKVDAAIDLVGLRETIDALPLGVDTRIGEEGAILSGGQRQRVGLARALYGDPQFVVLDEPNANLDEAGEQALLRALQALKARGAAVLAITHRTTFLPAVDRLLVMHEGQVALFGPRDEVLAALAKANQQARAQLSAPDVATPARVAAAGGAGR